MITMEHTHARRSRPAARTWLAAIPLVLLATYGIALAEDAPEAPPKSKWEFEVEPYAWLTGNFGSVTVKGRTAQISVSPSTLWGLLEDGNAFGAAAYLSASYDRFSFFVDSFGGYAEEAVNERVPTQLCNVSIRARDKIKFAMADFAFGYRLGKWTLPDRKRPFTLGVYVGTRYMWFLNKLTAHAGVAGGVQRAANVEDTFQWADPIIGVRWSVPVLDSLSVDFRGDIGGFDASSELVWGLLGTVRYWVPYTPMGVEPYIAAGYRTVAFERSASAGNIDLSYRGPLAGMGFVF